MEASTDHTVSHYLPPCQLVCCQKYPKISSFFWIFLCRKSSLTKQLIPGPFSLKSISLLLISVTFLYLSTIPSSMSAVGNKRGSQKQTIAFDENFIATPHQVTKCQKILFIPLLSVFLSIFFVFKFWSIETTTSNLQGLTHSNPSKNTNQVTVSNKHMNHLF